MRIELAHSSGFCFGVRKAVDRTFEVVESGAPGPVRSLGPIIHNPHVVGRLKDMGVEVVDTPNQVEPGGTLVIRAHGVPRGELQKAKDQGLQIVDATCPYVKVPQEIVRRLTKEGYHVFIVGNPQHPEIRGVVSYAETDGAVTVLAAGEDVPLIPGVRKVGVVSQTTLPAADYQRVVSQCALKYGEVRAVNTICDDTDTKQREAVALAERVQGMVIVGGRNSANTTHLAELCRAIQSNTHHVETAAEIDAAWFGGVEVVGVTAGASTPDWLIQDVVARLEQIGAAASPTAAERAAGERRPN